MVISAGARVKRAGEAMRGEDVELIARHQHGDEKSPYERLLGDAMRGDTALFTRDERSRRPGAWSIRCSDTCRRSKPTSPAAGARLGRAIIAGDEGWHDPKPEASAPC